MFNSFVIIKGQILLFAIKIRDREKRPNNGSATFVLPMLRVAIDQLGKKFMSPARQSGENDA